MLCWLCCAAGVCENSLVVCAHEHSAIKVGAGCKLDICQAWDGVVRQCHNWGALAVAGDAATQFIKVPPPLMADTTTGIIT